jgi:uncharacterized protein YcfL
MRRLIVCLMIPLLLIGCGNSAEEKTNTVDTTIVGSDNPQPSPDSSKLNHSDSVRK